MATRRTWNGCGSWSKASGWGRARRPTCVRRCSAIANATAGRWCRCSSGCAAWCWTSWSSSEPRARAIAPGPPGQHGVGDGMSALFVLGSLLDLIARYGYLVVALFIFAEGVGLPLPGEGALVVAAAAAAQGRLRLAGVLVAAVLGAVLGGTAGYWLGRGARRGLLARGPGWLRVAP